MDLALRFDGSATDVEEAEQTSSQAEGIQVVAFRPLPQEQKNIDYLRTGHGS
jgi:hypothetical protein